MSELSNLKCEACSVGAKRVTTEEIKSLMEELKGWELIVEGDVQKLKRVFHTDDFIQSVSLTNAIAQLAEAEDHHPKIILEYSSVTVLWWTHKINGLHKNDFIMAYNTSLAYQNVLKK
ncbi:4a-hydroxytetrahydrobiopterin dehydratase [Carboxylicivirga taeanensis]|uniref:4a-hydroxytetrahydrobiopterin dehydratase n=1 Tax=Carboxylicivirga taeanensis TaxID=1416875 RepID=UPI003F6DBE25